MRSLSNSVLQLVKLPGQLTLGFVGKCGGILRSYRLTRAKNRLALPRRLVSDMRAKLALELAGVDKDDAPASTEDERLVAAILARTRENNRNNVVRTAAYWELFAAHPELHWALLAHLVSRNGGWSMTDLRGSYMPDLLDEASRRDVFGLLESCNSLIFGDAYPQLMLYAEGKRRGDRAGLFRLLPRFGVSAFMRPFWERFAADGDPAPLTVALVVNEQHFIQRRVVEDPYYRDRVIRTSSFRGQARLQLNQIAFPLRLTDRDGGSPLRLAGRVLENFESLRERIAFGKCLYAMLFGYPAILKGAIAFASETPHTGSRADYWPMFFAAECKEAALGEPRGDDETSRWASPTLDEAWPDSPLLPAKEEDWFRSVSALSHLRRLKRPFAVDMTREFLFGRRKIQAAALLVRSFRNGESSLRTGRG